MTDPHVQAWRSAHTTLGSRLVDLESQADVALARTGVLTGTTAAAWADADAGLAHAWETYRVLDEVLDDVEADPARAAALLTTSQVPGAGGAPADPSDRPDRRQRRGRRRPGGGRPPGRRVGLARPPRGRGPGRRGRGGGRPPPSGPPPPSPSWWPPTRSRSPRPTSWAWSRPRPSAGTARPPGRRRPRASTSTSPPPATPLAALTADVDGAADELAHAATRVAGIRTGVPVPDLDALGALARPHRGRRGPAARPTGPVSPPTWPPGGPRPTPAAPRSTPPSAPPAPACAGARRARACGPRCGPRRAPASSTSTRPWPRR